jgi:hypothetical protein
MVSSKKRGGQAVGNNRGSEMYHALGHNFFGVDDILV